MRLTLPKIYPITDRQLSGLSHAEQVQRLINGGATFVQLREKHLPPIDFLRDAEAASKVAGNNRVTLIINDRVEIAMAISARGVHLGQDDMPVEAARRLVQDDTLIGFSTHTQQQMETAVRLPIDYVAFGPVLRPAVNRIRIRQWDLSSCARSGTLQQISHSWPSEGFPPLTSKPSSRPAPILLRSSPQLSANGPRLSTTCEECLSWPAFELKLPQIFLLAFSATHQR